MIEAGKQAPLFTLKDQNGNPVALKEYRGRKVALYFYPKDMTPGCTKQACNLRDHIKALDKAGVVVIGVSPDNEKSHARFADAHELSFTLAADPDKKVLQKYGVWGEKSMYGRKYMGVMRTTFLIDEKGKVAKVIAKPKVADHAKEVMDGFAG